MKYHYYLHFTESTKKKKKSSSDVYSGSLKEDPVKKENSTVS